MGSRSRTMAFVCICYLDDAVLFLPINNANHRQLHASDNNFKHNNGFSSLSDQHSTPRMGGVETVSYTHLTLPTKA